MILETSLVGVCVTCFLNSLPSDTIFRSVSKGYSSPGINLKFKKKIKVI